MTSVVARREPLQTLSMSSTQRMTTRRRSARHAFDDDEASVGNNANKKPRIDSGKGNGVAGKRKTAYDENDDGFTFSRKTTRRTRAAAATATEPVLVEPPEPVTKSTARRTKKTDPTPQQPSEDSALTRKRRSARLSGEKTQLPLTGRESRVVTPEKPRRSRKALGTAAHDEVEGSPELVGQQSQEIRVDKKRGTTLISLPFADTPVIKRNKEMRKGSGSGHRRSSTGLRGRRASSLIDSGTSNAVPHAEVEIADFYKHIEQSLPEPRRMKQLLTWCGTRALLAKPRGDEKNSNVIMAARAIQQELLDDFANKSEMSDWFSREDVESTNIPKKPNPRNIENADRIIELEMEIKRLESEERAWKTLSAPLPPPAPQITTAHEEDPSTISAALLADPTQAAILDLLRPPPSSTHTITATTSPLPPAHPSSLSARISALAAALEPTVDAFADAAHALTQERARADTAASRVLAAASDQLEARDHEVRERAGTGSVGVREVLGALGKLLGGRE